MGTLVVVVCLPLLSTLIVTERWDSRRKLNSVECHNDKKREKVDDKINLGKRWLMRICRMMTMGNARDRIWIHLPTSRTVDLPETSNQLMVSRLLMSRIAGEKQARTTSQLLLLCLLDISHRSISGCRLVLPLHGSCSHRIMIRFLRAHKMETIEQQFFRNNPIATR